MSELFLLQNKFQDYLLDSKNDIYSDVIETTKVSTDVRLSIYGEAYRLRLLEALATSYPVMKIYLGHEQFEELGYKYIARYPSHFRSIRWFGDRLEFFLKDNAPYSNFPYLSELAKVEWTMTLVFDAPDSDVATVESLGAIPPESWVDMRLLIHPSARLVKVEWNIVPIWQAISKEETPTELLQSEQPINWIFWRKDLMNYYCSLTDDEASAIDAVLKGFSFGEICEVLCQWINEDDVAMRAASLLKGWLSASLIADIKY